MKAHPAAELFPMLHGDELNALASDIKARGLAHPIITLGGLILDGRNRFKACGIAGVTPTFERYKGKDPLGYVVSANVARRHLDPSQLAIVAAKLKPLFEAEAKERMLSGHPSAGLRQGKASEMAASAVGVSARSVEKAAKVLENGSASLVKAVESGSVTINDAVRIVRQPKAEQRKAVAMVEAGEIDTVAHAVESMHPAAEPEEYTEAEQEADAMADYEAMTRIIDADDKLSAAMEEVRKAKAIGAASEALYASAGRELASMKREAQRWMRKAKKSAACPGCKAALGAE